VGKRGGGKKSSSVQFRDAVCTTLLIVDGSECKVLPCKAKKQRHVSIAAAGLKPENALRLKI